MFALARICGVLWLAGLFGMWVAKCVFFREPGDVAFDAFLNLWVAGALTHCFLTALVLVVGEAESAE